MCIGVSKITPSKSAEHRCDTALSGCLPCQYRLAIGRSRDFPVPRRFRRLSARDGNVRVACRWRQAHRGVVPGEERTRVPEVPHAARLQVLRLRDHAAPRAGHHLRRRPQRLGQVQRGRRPVLGHGRAGREEPARRQDGGRHLRRHHQPGAARPRRGRAHHRQQRRRPADRLRRGDDQPPDVPLRAERVRDQRRQLPPARRAGPAVRQRARPRDARDRRPGPARPDPARGPRGAPGDHRGGGRRTQAPQAQGKGAAQARRDAGST